MSTYLDHPYQGTPYVSGVPVDLIMKVGMVKQQKYDQNLASVNEQLGKLDQYNITKPSDKMFLNQKMNDLTNDLNSFSGQDIGDSKVYGQLMGMTSKFYNDPEVYGRIADNQKHNAAVKQMDDMVKDDPTTYNPVNDYIFKKRENSWMSDPNAKWSSSYVPNTDTHKWADGLIKTALANPDVRNEIEYVHTPDGRLVIDPITGEYQRRGSQQIKEVTANKIHGILLAGMDSKIQNQLMMEREYNIDQMDPKTVASNLLDKVRTSRAKITDIENSLLTDDLTDDQKANLNSLKSQYTNFVSSHAKMVDYIGKTGDVSQYYSPSKWIDDFANEYANAYQTKSEGEFKDDPYNLKRYENELQKGLEKTKTELDYTEKVGLAAAGIGPNGKKLTKPDGSLTIANEFEDHMLGDLNINGKASINSNEMSTLFNSSSKVRDDGSFDIEVHSQPAFLDVQPTLKALGVDITNAKSMALAKVNTEFNSWQKTAEGHFDSSEDSSKIADLLDKAHTQWHWYNNGVDAEMAKRLGVSPQEIRKYVSQSPVGINVSFKRNINDFFNSTKGKALAKQVKAETGMDVTSAQDRQLVQNTVNNPIISNALNAIGDMLSNPKLGRVNVVPADGDNVFTGSDGNAYTKVFAQVSQRQLGQAVGRYHYIGSDGYNKLVDAGIVINTGRKDKDGEDIYEIPIITKVNVDLGSANQRYLGEHSNKTYEDNIGEYTDHWNNTAKDIANLKLNGILGNSLENITTDVAKHLNDLNISAADRAQAVAIMNKNSRLLSNTTIPPDRTTKLQIMKVLNYLKNWDGSNDPIPESKPTPTNPFASTSTNPGTNPAVLLKTPGNKYEYTTRIKEIKEGIAAVESVGRGGYHATSSIGAMGKYQFTDTTLRKSVFDKYYKDKYTSYESFKSKFKDSPDLQEEVMDKYLMDIGHEANWNMGKAALIHFVGKSGLDDLLSGKQNWNSNPTPDTPNATPIKYLSKFATHIKNN